MCLHVDEEETLMSTVGVETLRCCWIHLKNVLKGHCIINILLILYHDTCHDVTGIMSTIVHL